MRHFEQIVLSTEDGKKTIIERRFNDGAIEFWSLMTVGYNDGQSQANAQVPFQIEVPTRAGNAEIPDNQRRDMAFEMFDSTAADFAPKAKEQFQRQLEIHAKKESSKILLANCLPPTPKFN